MNARVCVAMVQEQKFVAQLKDICDNMDGISIFGG